MSDEKRESPQTVSTDELVDAAKKLLEAWDAQMPLGKPKVSVRFKIAIPKVRRLIDLIEESKLKSTSPSTESPQAVSDDDEVRGKIQSLLDYAEHHAGCGVFYSPEEPCDCGLSRTLEWAQDFLDQTPEPVTLTAEGESVKSADQMLIDALRLDVLRARNAHSLACKRIAELESQLKRTVTQWQDAAVTWGKERADLKSENERLKRALEEKGE